VPFFQKLFGFYITICQLLFCGAFFGVQCEEGVNTLEHFIGTVEIII